MAPDFDFVMEALGRVFAARWLPRRQKPDCSQSETNTLGGCDSTCPTLSTSPLNLH